MDIDWRLNYDTPAPVPSFGRDPTRMKRDPSTLPLASRLALGWGKIRRAWLITCRPALVRKSLTRRRGECRRTGACCHLLVTCPALEGAGDVHRCTNYLHRGPNCSIFPIDERDLRDRDLIMPDVPCGYSFIPVSDVAKRAGKENGNGNGHGNGNENGKALHVFPWEIDGNALGGKVRRTTPFAMTCAFLSTFRSILRAPERNVHARKPCPSRKLHV
jgi:hypothetical protein